MVIDYSKWDKLTFSDDESAEEDRGSNDDRRGMEPGRPFDGTFCTASRHAVVRDSLRREEGETSILLLINSHIRDSLLERMQANGITGARQFAQGKTNSTITVPCGMHGKSGDFFPGLTRDQAIALVAALLGMTTSQYTKIVGDDLGDSLTLPTVPYDLQPNTVTRDCILRLHHGTEQQSLYHRVPGPELKTCKMGALCGGPVVVFRASFLWDTCKCGDFEFSYYQLENIACEEGDLTNKIRELLDTAMYPY